MRSDGRGRSCSHDVGSDGIGRDSEQRVDERRGRRAASSISAPNSNSSTTIGSIHHFLLCRRKYQKSLTHASVSTAC